ncbi:histone-like nucleoid-structuring protein Lsr2 [Streptomyces decoyicus]
MAQKVVTIVTDDITGEESSDVTTHTFSIDGIQYEIDLGPESHDKFMKALAPFTEHGRRVKRQRIFPSPTAKKATQDRTAQVRAWAEKRGLGISKRGRIPANIMEEYEKAHSG